MNSKITAPKNEQKLIILAPKVENTIKIHKLENNSLDLEKLALAVAKHETNNCKLGYGVSYNNCFGIKNGNTAPCKKIGRNRMCIYNNPQESYEAFKIIRSKWYKTLPNLQLAKRWSGNDRAEEWRKNVLYFYNET